MSKKHGKLKRLYSKKDDSMMNESTDFENETAEERYRKWNVESIGMSIQTFKELDSGIKDAIEGKYSVPKRTNPDIRKLFNLVGE